MLMEIGIGSRFSRGMPECVTSASVATPLEEGVEFGVERRKEVGENMDKIDNEQNPRRSVSRRAIVKGAAWAVPAVAVAVATPARAASAGLVIEPNTGPVPTGVCTPLGTISFKITNNGAPAAGTAIVVALPSGFTWVDGSTAPKTFTANASGIVDLTNLIKTGSRPGTYDVVGTIVSNGATASIPVMVSGLWINNNSVGYGGTHLYPVYTSAPTDPATPGVPDYWAYCIEHNVGARTLIAATPGGLSSYLGGNYLAGSADIYSKVLWIIQNSYPALPLATFGQNAGVPNLSANDAVEAVQYAIWRYTDLTYDANWNFETPDSATVYWYLIGQINAGLRGTASGVTGQIISVPTGPCKTPTGGDHAQSQILVVPA